MPANDPSTCQKDAAYMQDSYGRALLDNPNLDGCNQDVIGDLDGWHDDCYLDSSQPWMFKSPNPNYNSVQTMQSFCWSAHGVWLQLPGQPLSTPPAAVVSATTAPLPPLQQSLSSASSEAPASSTVADHPQGSADPSLTAAPMAVASDTFTTVLSSSLAPLASFAASSSALAGSSPTRIVISLPQPSNNALSANSVVMPHQDLPAQGPPIALIVGCVVGAIVLLAILCTVFMMRRRKDADPEHMMRGGSERSTARHVKLDDSQYENQIPMYATSSRSGTSDYDAGLDRKAQTATNDDISILHQSPSGKYAASDSRVPTVQRSRRPHNASQRGVMSADEKRFPRDPSVFDAVLNASYSGADGKALSGTPATEWNVEQVMIWAREVPEIGAELSSMVQFHRITGEVLLQLRREDWKNDFGLRIGHAVMVDNAVERLRWLQQHGNEAPPLYVEKH